MNGEISITKTTRQIPHHFVVNFLKNSYTKIKT